MRKAMIAVVLASLASDTALAAPFDAGYSTSGFLSARTRVIKKKLAPEVAQPRQADVEIDESVQKFLLQNEVPRTADGAWDIQQLVDIVNLRAGDTATRVAASESGYAISRVSEAREPQYRASPFRYSEEDEALGKTTCPENFDGSVVASTRQRDSLGERIINVGGQYANFAGTGTALTVEAAGYANHTRNYKLNYVTPLGRHECDTDDWVWIAGGTLAATEVDSPGFNNKEEKVELTLVYTQVLNDSSITWSISLTGNEVDREIGTTIQEEAQRVLAVGRREKWGAHELEFGLVQGINGLGASSQDHPRRLRGGSDVDFTEVFASYSRSLEFERTDWALDVKLLARYSPDDLPAGQGFVFGSMVGWGMGSAYDIGEFSGDWGAGLSTRASRTDRGINSYLLWEVGRAGRHNPVGNEEKTDSAASLAIGFGYTGKRLGQTLKANLEFAQPLTRDVVIPPEIKRGCE